MPRDRMLVALPCKLSPGVFSGEREFSVQLANGEWYTSFAPRQFCWNNSGQLVTTHEPPNCTDGMIAGKIVDYLADDQVFVEVPDGEVVSVDTSIIVDRPTPIVPPSQPTRV